MKKLMTMLAAVGMAFGLFADKVTTSFETDQDGVDISLMKFTPGTGWTWTGTPAAFDLTASEAQNAPYAESGENARRTTELDVNQANYLELKTGTDTLELNAGSGNVFVDQLVKFTGFEDPQTNLTADAKIAVWMSEFWNDDETEAETNLYVTCATVDPTGTAETKAFKIDGEFSLDTWYRVTIRNIDDIVANPSQAHPSRAGFIVYINGELKASKEAEEVYYGEVLKGRAKAYNAAGQLFPAISTENVALNAIGYKGIGAIDDILVDATGPAFAQEVTFTLEGPKGLTYAVSNELNTAEIVLEDGEYTVKKGAKVNIYAIPAAGKFVNPAFVQKTVAATGAITLSGDFIVTSAGAKTVIDTVETYYSELEEAIEAAEEATGSSIVVTALGEENSADVDDFTVALASNATITVTAATKAWSIGTASLEGTITNRSISGSSAVLTGALTIGDGAFLDVEEIDLDGKVITLDGSGSVKTVSTELKTGEEIVCTDSSDYEVMVVGGEDEHIYVRRAIVKTGTVIFICEKTNLNTTNDTTAIGAAIPYPTIEETETTINKGWFTNAECTEAVTGNEKVTATEQTFYFKAVDAVAKVGTEKFETVTAALLKVQELEVGDAYSITVTALKADGLTIEQADQSVTLAKDETITITPAGWAFSGAFAGTVTLAPGKQIVSVGAATGTINVPAGYKLVTTENPAAGTFTYTAVECVYVAQIGSAMYESADEAFAEVEKNGGKVEIIASCPFSGSYVFTNANVEISVATNVTLTRTAPVGQTKCKDRPFKVYNRKTLTFSGEGTILKGEGFTETTDPSTMINIGKDDCYEYDSDECGHVIVNGGNLIDLTGSNACSIDCGSFTMNGGYIKSERDGGHAVRVSSKTVDGSAAIVTLNAGKLEAANSAIGVKIADDGTPTITAVQGRDDTAIITGVKGSDTFAGTITMSLTAGENLLFSNDKSEFAPRGYGYVESETVTDWYKLGLATYTITAVSGTIAGEASKTYTMDKAKAQDFALVAAAPETGKTFKEWTLTATTVDHENVTFDDATAASAILTVGAGAIGNYTVTATYSNLQVTATFVDQGATTKVQTNDYGFTPEAPETTGKDGYTFEKWDPAVAAITADTTFTAVYTANVYAVTFTTNNIEVVEAATTAQYGATLKTEQIPSFTGGTWDVNPATATITGPTTFNYTIKDAPAPTPVDPGEEKNYDTEKEAEDAADAINKNKEAMINVPTEASGDKTAYLARVEAKVKGTKVVVDIAAEAEATFEGELDDEMEKTAVAAALTDANATTATITTKAGFYYWIEGGVEVGTIDTNGKAVIGDGSTVELPKPALGTTTKAFYKLAVGVKEPAAE